MQAVDVSERTVGLTAAREIPAQVGEVESLPFRDGEFGCVYSGRVLYQAADAPRATRECARGLKPAGRLVAATVCGDDVAELWVLAPQVPKLSESFRATTRHAVFVAERPL